MPTREEIREGIPYCDCGLTGGCEKCQPPTMAGIRITTTSIDEIIKGALVEAGLFYLENRDGDKNTSEELQRITQQLKQDLHSQWGAIKKEGHRCKNSKGMEVIRPYPSLLCSCCRVTDGSTDVTQWESLREG